VIIFVDIQMSEQSKYNKINFIAPKLSSYKI